MTADMIPVLMYGCIVSDYSHRLQEKQGHSRQVFVLSASIYVNTWRHIHFNKAADGHIERKIKREGDVNAEAK